MKWGRFMLGVATGLATAYFIYQEQKYKPLQPEKVVKMLKDHYRSQLAIMGTWIHLEPRTKEINGIECHTYQCGLTALMEGKPYFIECVVDADDGTILSSTAN